MVALHLAILNETQIVFCMHFVGTQLIAALRCINIQWFCYSSRKKNEKQQRQVIFYIGRWLNQNSSTCSCNVQMPTCKLTLFSTTLPKYHQYFVQGFNFVPRFSLSSQAFNSSLPIDDILSIIFHTSIYCYPLQLHMFHSCAPQTLF